MLYHEHLLANGIRLIHIAATGRVAHAALMVHTGSRDETSEIQGMAHFLEHVFFKGTTHRKAYHINNRLDEVGGELNAYTAKEETCIHASFLSEYFPRAIELMADIFFHSTFPEKELEKEKEVILDEINSYLDNPSEQIADDFEELVFPNHPLGYKILGTPEIIQNFTRDQVIRFVQENYYTDEMVLVTMGDFPLYRIVRLFEKYFSDQPARLNKPERQAFNAYRPQYSEQQKDSYQTHCMLGREAYSVNHPLRLPMYVLSNYLGGPGMNSRLNMVLREKHGLAYHVEMNYAPYSDTGLLTLYFGTENGNLKKALRLIERELKRLSAQPLTAVQLEKAKKQLIGQLALANESPINQVLSMAKSYLVFGRCDSLEEVNAKILGVTLEQIEQVSREIFDFETLSQLIYR